MAWKRDNLRVSLFSVKSIEDSGLDSPYGEGSSFLTPHDPLRKTISMPSQTILQALSSPGVASGGPSPSPGETYLDAMETLPKHKNSRKEAGLRKRNGRRRNSSFDDDPSDGNEVGDEQSLSVYGGQQGLEKRRDPRVLWNLLAAGRTPLTGIEEDDPEDLEVIDSLDGKLIYNVKTEGKGGSGQSSGKAPESGEMMPNKQSAIESNGHLKSSSTRGREDFGTVRLQPKSDGADSDFIGNLRPAPTAESGSGNLDALQPDRGEQARTRWRRLKHTLTFAHHMSANVKSASSDFEHGEEERTTEKLNSAGDGAGKPSAGIPSAGKPSAGKSSATSGGGTKKPSEAQFRAKGRKGMEGMLVRQDRGFMCLVQDFYVACLKLPIGQFFVGVFLAPVALGLFFTPIYLLDMGGLSTEGSAGEEILSAERVSSVKQTLYALLHVFIYALSLSTTFGGSPVAALSPYCLVIANVHTLMGQFLFVFLSGAVFARMSQPSHPIRCCKTAIIKADDYSSSPSEQLKEKSKVFAVRLVLTGPPPCELVDAKICLTFRIFIKLPSGSMFCSTQDLNLVRPEVSYLRYGIMVRHVIDKKSPLFEHTMDSLLDGDASFSLTIMALERASMQPIFHLEDYYVCDGDVAWDADYIDFIHVNKRGHRVLNHSRLDLLKVTDNTKMAGSWKRKTLSVQGRKELEKTPPSSDDQTISSDDQSILKGAALTTVKSKALHSKSQSFTRASH